VKPTSIVFLVVAVLLIIGGMITCSVAKNIAETDGYSLFHETEDGTSYRQYEFDGKPVTKIDLAVEDAEICIYGDSETSYIELFNFREGLYTFSTSGTIIALDQIPDIESLMDFSGGFSFGGIRQFFHGKTDTDAKRRVNVYLSALTDDLKVIAIDAQNCTVSLDSLSTQCDISVNGNSLSITAKDMHTTSALNVTAESAAVTLDNATVNAFTLEAKTGDIRANAFSFKSFDCTLEEGSAAISTLLPLQRYEVNVSAGTGAVRFDGMDRLRPYTVKAGEDAIGTIRFDSEKASFTVTDASHTAN